MGSWSGNLYPHTLQCHLYSYYKSKFSYHENHNCHLPKYECHGHDASLKQEGGLQIAMDQFLLAINNKKVGSSTKQKGLGKTATFLLVLLWTVAFYCCNFRKFLF